MARVLQRALDQPHHRGSLETAFDDLSSQARNQRRQLLGLLGPGQLTRSSTLGLLGSQLFFASCHTQRPARGLELLAFGLLGSQLLGLELLAAGLLDGALFFLLLGSDNLGSALGFAIGFTLGLQLRLQPLHLSLQLVGSVGGHSSGVGVVGVHLLLLFYHSLRKVFLLQCLHYSVQFIYCQQLFCYTFYCLTALLQCLYYTASTNFVKHFKKLI